MPPNSNAGPPLLQLPLPARAGRRCFVRSLVRDVLAARLPGFFLGRRYRVSRSPMLAHEADVTTSDGVADLFDATSAAFGRIDIVVNNAGLVVKKPLADTTDADYDRVFEVNAKAAFLVMREAARRMAEVDDVAPLIACLSSDQAGWITAQTIRVNGGMA